MVKELCLLILTGELLHVVMLRVDENIVPAHITMQNTFVFEAHLMGWEIINDLFTIDIRPTHL